MELVDKNGGFGIFQFDSKEAVLLERMQALAKNQNKYTLGWDRYPQTQEFSALVRDLFPEVPLEPSYSVYCPEQTSHYYRPFAPYSEVRTDSNFPKGTIINQHGNNRSGLTILFSALAEQNQYPISMTLLDFYAPSIADDIIDILKQHETPALEGLVHLPIAERGEKDQDHGYGIAEVHRLAAVLQLYERSKNLVNNSEGIIGVSQRELKVLRKDSLQHENLAIRDLSRNRYQKELQKLVNY